MSDRIPADFALRVSMGQSDPEIADYAGVSPRTVLRWRTKLGLPSRWVPERAEHGTDARYHSGCRCTPCRAAHAAEQRAWSRAYARARAYRRQAVSA